VNSAHHSGTNYGPAVHARAHGRVNLIGEHTDYNGGWVLPTSIPQFTEVKLTPNGSGMVKLQSTQGAAKTRFGAYELGHERKTETWIDYLQGATRLLLQESANSLISGFTVEIHSNVPEGSGLSSSAALEMSFLKALREAFQLKHTDTELALLGQRIENEFVGARVGIMDQMACALARAGEALFLDTKTLNYEQVRLPREEMDLLVINSGISHRNVGGGYNQRRAECEEACAILKIKELRELELKDLEKLNALPEILKKRAHHVITENARVFAAVDAIREKNLIRLGHLFQESHESMSKDYEVSLPEIDQLVALLSQEKNVYGARLTGGGFGGSVVAIAKKNTAREIAAKLAPQYEKTTGEKLSVLVQE
jgi:galactokinase